MPGRIASFFRNLLRKRAVEQALDDELQSAVELLTQEKMKQGLSHPEARREAVIELGGVEHEESRALRHPHRVVVHLRCPVTEISEERAGIDAGS